MLKNVLSFLALNLLPIPIFADDNHGYRGQRMYVDDGELWSPLKVVERRGGSTSGVVDPNQNSKKMVVSPVASKLPSRSKPDYQPSQLVFKKVKIRGRLSKPRIKFKRQRLRIGRSDQLGRPRTFEKIFTAPKGGF